MKLALSLASPLNIFEVCHRDDVIDHLFLLRGNLSDPGLCTQYPSMPRSCLLGVWNAKGRHHISLAVETFEMFHQPVTVFLQLFITYRPLITGEECLVLSPLPLHLVIDFLNLSQRIQKVGAITAFLGLMCLRHPPVDDLEQPLGFS